MDRRTQIDQKFATHVVEDAALSQDDTLLLLGVVDAGLVAVLATQHDHVETVGLQSLAWAFNQTVTVSEAELLSTHAVVSKIKIEKNYRAREACCQQRAWCPAASSQRTWSWALRRSPRFPAKRDGQRIGFATVHSKTRFLSGSALHSFNHISLPLCLNSDHFLDTRSYL